MNIIKRYWKEALIGFFTGILNGLFGSGGGTVVVFAMEKYLGVDPKKSHSSAVLIILMMSLVSSVFYVYNGYFNFKLWLYVSIGGIIGGLIGAKFISKISNR